MIGKESMGELIKQWFWNTNVLNNSIFYICGPPGMLKAMQALLQEDLNIPKERIKVEEFTGYWWLMFN